MSSTWTYSSKICFLNHWISGQKPHLIRNGKRIDCKFSNYVPFVVPGLSASSSSTTSPPTSPSSSSQDSVFDVNRYTNNPVPERCGSTSEELQGNPLHETNRNPNKHENEGREEVQSDLLHELPGWLQDFLQKTCWPVVPRAEHFGELITADHKVLSEESESRDNHRYAVVVQDLATKWLQSFPCKAKTSQETQKNRMKFLEPTRKPKVTYTDNSWEFGKSCEELFWNHCMSTPHRSETNGIAERAVRRGKEGTSAVLLQSCLGNEWWADSVECFCFLRNIQSRSLV